MKKIAVFDLDGTLADLTHRLHYITDKPKDWNRFFNTCYKDEPIKWMIDIINNINDFTHDVWIVTGRSDSVKERTIDWLDENNIIYNELRMRKTGDFRHDTEVKPELIEDVKDRIDYIVEDRQSMVNKWRKLGFNVLQCAKGDF